MMQRSGYIFLFFLLTNVFAFASDADYAGIVMLTEHDERYVDISGVTLPNKQVR